MLKHGEPNPLNIFGLRRLDHCPPHFTPVEFEIGYSQEKAITDWLYENLEGRFYMGVVDNSNKNSYHRKNVVAFEIHGEASYFSLYLPQLLDR